MMDSPFCMARKQRHETFRDAAYATTSIRWGRGLVGVFGIAALVGLGLHLTKPEWQPPTYGAELSGTEACGVLNGARPNHNRTWQEVAKADRRFAQQAISGHTREVFEEDKLMVQCTASYNPLRSSGLSF